MKVQIYSDNTVSIDGKHIGGIKAVTRSGTVQTATGHYGQERMTTRITTVDGPVDLDVPPVP